ncbi:Regulator of telomere elongation helicase 1 homolog [Linum grandiflorum]
MHSVGVVEAIAQYKSTKRRRIITLSAFHFQQWRENQPSFLSRVQFWVLTSQTRVLEGNQPVKKEFLPSAATRMPTYKIRGIDVDFPFEAYDCQLVYMEKVIESLQNKCNALLESPTGTGKTLCLLCASLAWRKSLGEFSTGKKPEFSSSQSSSSSLPTIVYTSRTHSQLRQVIQELKRCSYRPKMVILGSREQLCIHEEVSTLRGKAQTNACRHISRNRGKRQCSHFCQVSDYVKQNPHLGDQPVDIEDLVKIGKQFGPCPYYLSRDLHKSVDILFAPYNYLIDRSNRKSLTVDWENSILIFDEAHNLEGICADAASFDLPSGLLTTCISEAQSCIDISILRKDISQNPENFAILKGEFIFFTCLTLLMKLEKRIAEIPIESGELGFTRPGPYIYELLADLNLTHDTASKLIDTIEEGAGLIEEDKQKTTKGTVCRLESIADILKLVFKEKDNSHATFYRVHVREGQAYAPDVFKGNASRTLSWWCFNPGIAMEEFSKMGVGSIILTSGTLSPMESFAQELKLSFPVRLENPHVISANQIWAGVVPVGPSGHSFNSSYRNRDSEEYKRELGNAIVNFARIVPDGLLVFFPSYYVLDKSIECWKSTDNNNSTPIWERICRYKKPVVEPRQSSLFPSAIEDYMAKLKNSSHSGAVFFAVCRGKVSEGLDFADHAGRAVIITGVPFPMWHDPKVRLKREFLDNQAVFSKGEFKSDILTGEGWYSQQASRAVNQAVGRVIRHRHDYGAIIFCDERFSNANQQSQISRWIRPYLKCHPGFGDVIFTLSRFFRDGVFKDSTVLKSKEQVTQEKMSQEMVKANVASLLFSCSFTIMPTNKKTSDISSVFPLLQDKSFMDSSKLQEVLPANGASPNPPKNNQDFILKYSKGLISKEKKVLVLGGNAIQHQDKETVNLISESSARGIPSGYGLVPCYAKKRKISKGGHNEEIADKSIDERSKSNNSGSEEQKFTLDDRTQSHALARSQVACERGLLQKGKTDTAHHSKASLTEDKEAKGSDFLNQAKEKLSASEYIEFVSLMKGLRSKVMKIGQVLPSIVKLFSGPERFQLLQRFRDYVPAKYRPLYEQYIRTNGQSSGTMETEGKNR